MDSYRRSLQRHDFLDSVLYKISNKTMIYETLKFKGWLVTKKKSTISSLNPIIIGGCPRSGTTLGRALIGIHPAITSPEKEYNLLMWITNDSILKDVFLFDQRELSKLKHLKKDLVSLAEQILHLYMIKKQKSHIAIKHPYHILLIDELFHYFPKMKFIHIIRDGRDTVCSLRTHPKRKIVDGKIVSTNIRNPFPWCVRRWVVSINKGKNWRKSNWYIEIKYEDLVYNTPETVNKIFKFLNLNILAKKEIDTFYQNQSNKNHLQNIEVSQPIYEKTIGRWKKDMTEHEKSIFKKMAGQLLIELNYEKNMHW